MLSLVVAVPFALAEDIEQRTTQADEGQDQKLVVSGLVETGWLEFNNTDFRLLDETSDQAILDSDDRNAIAFTGGNIELGYQVEDPTRVVVSISHRGIWGNDQLGSVNAYGGMFYFSALYSEYQATGDLRFRIGRQFYSIGGMPGREYAFSDVIDGLRVDWDLGFGNLVILPIHVVSATGENDNANFFNFIGQSDTSTYGFRGDHMSRRHGATLELSPNQNLEAAIYGFYTDVAALGTGSDISYEGTLGNFTDNDWVANFGARAALTAGIITPYAGVDLSQGIDRKELVAQDVDTNGMALMGGVAVDTTGEDEPAGLEADASFYMATGAKHSEDGLMSSHGYVGMKARQSGGLLANTLMGWHPSAYVDIGGVANSPHDIRSRKAGSMVAALNLEYSGLGAFDVGAGFWYFQDTGSSDVKFTELDSIDPPFGYSREEFAAQKRLGKTLGEEIDLWTDINLSEHAALNITGGVFLPSAFHKIEVARVAGSALGGQEMAWVVGGGTKVSF